MSKFAYPRMQIRTRIPAREAPGMRIHMRMPVQEPGMRNTYICEYRRYPRMRIFVTYLNNTSFWQMGAAFVTEYRLLHYNNYSEY